MKDLADRFMVEHSEARNKPSTVAGNRTNLKGHILPALGKVKVADVKRSDVADLVGRLRDRPTTSNHCLSLLRKVFNLAELWGLRPDGTNPCRHIQKYAGSKRTRLITDDELARLYGYLNQADAEGLEHPLLTLAIRLQFDFAARMSEVLQLQWEWINFVHRRVVWPDSKTGGMSKPLSAAAVLLLRAAPRYAGSKFVIPALFDGSKPMPKHTYWAAWRRILERAGLPHCGTHAVRHRAATDIANSGVPVKVGMALTAHKTVTMFMRYVHTEDDPIRQAAETVTSRRRIVVRGSVPPAEGDLSEKPLEDPAAAAAAAAPRGSRRSSIAVRQAQGSATIGPTGTERVRTAPPRQSPRVGSLGSRRRSMSDCRNPEGRWPPMEIMRRANEVDDTGLIPFVDTDAAARYLALSPHSLECYRSLGGGPPFYKFGKFVRYAVADLQAWAAQRRCERTPGDNSGTY